MSWILHIRNLQYCNLISVLSRIFKTYVTYTINKIYQKFIIKPCLDRYLYSICYVVQKWMYLSKHVPWILHSAWPQVNFPVNNLQFKTFSTFSEKTTMCNPKHHSHSLLDQFYINNKMQWSHMLINFLSYLTVW